MELTEKISWLMARAFVAKTLYRYSTTSDLHRALQSGWQALLLRLQVDHKAKRRLMEVLDGLENNRKLVE